MRHKIYGKHLGRDKNARTNLFRSLVQSLFTHGTIETSEAKAKAVKGLVDKVINLAKVKRTQPLLQSFLTDKLLRERLIKEIIPKLGSRNSGYTSQVKLGSRLGDQTMMVKMSLIGVDELKPIQKELRVKSQESSKKPIRTETKKVEKAEKVKKPTKPVRKRRQKA